MNKIAPFISMCMAAMISAGITARADTEFTYQGELKENGGLANGSFIMEFSLWDAGVGGNQIGSTLVHNGVQVIEGKFAVELDFGADAFDNSGRWLKIVVSGFTLSPRNPITRSPYSIQTRGIFVDEVQKVGIGTTNPQHKLHVADDVNTGPVIFGHATRFNSSSAAAVTGQSEGVSGIGVYGFAASPTGLNYGVKGYSYSTSGIGVYGSAQRETGISYGLYGLATSNLGTAVYGHASNSSGNTKAIFGKCVSSTGFAGYFDGRGYFKDEVGFGTTNPLYPVHAFSINGTAIYASSNNDTAIRGEGDWGVEGTSTDPDGRGVFGYGASLTGTNYGVYGLSASDQGAGVYGYNTNPTGTTYGVYGQSDSAVGRAVYGNATATTSQNYGVYGVSASPDGEGVFGWNTATTGVTSGVHGQTDSDAGYGVYGHATQPTGFGIGVLGKSDSVAGFDFYAGGAGVNYGEPSSRRWKSNIVPIDDPLAKIARIRGVHFDWDTEHGGRHDVGMIAEEVGAVLPEIVVFEENGIDAKGMDYSKMTPLLVEAVKALRAEKNDDITSLRADNESLRIDNEILHNENASLRERLVSLELLVEQLASAQQKEDSQ